MNLSVLKRFFEPLMERQLWVPPAILSIILIGILQFNFLAFHTFSELFAIVISFVMFAVAWSSKSFSSNRFLLFLASGYFWIGSLDLMHSLVYPEVNIFPSENQHRSTQFWVGTRFFESLILLSAPFAAAKVKDARLLFLGFGIAATALIFAVMSDTFPTAFVEETGLTPFKIYSEYVIVFILTLALISVLRFGAGISNREKSLITLSILATMAAELFFTFYVSVFSISNAAGHIFKLFSFWFIFQAIVVANLERPFFELARVKNYNRLLFESSTLGLALCKMDGTLVDVNSAYASMLGRTVEETLGLSYWEITPKKYIPQEEIQLNSLSKIGRYGPYIKEYIHEDGSLVPVQLHGKTIELNGEKLIWSSVEDITERQALEAQLRQSQKMEVVGQLTGGIAHDFNNILAVILGNTELLQHKISDDKAAADLFADLRIAIDRASALADRLLTFSRKQILELRVADVNKLICGLESMLKHTLHESIHFELNSQKDLWSVKIDEHLFENALLNLIINARDSMPNGGALSVNTENFTLDRSRVDHDGDIPTGDYVKVVVADSGSGMPPAVLEKVFEPFFTTKAVGKGSGLGLSMVYGFVKQSDGQIKISSTQGQGTKISLYLPRSMAKPTVADSKNTRNSEKDARKNARILVVEDDPDLRRVVLLNLDSQRYVYSEASDGKAAIEHLVNGPAFDLLLTDIVLPGGMNGYEIAAKARQIQPNIRIVFMTGYNDFDTSPAEFAHPHPTLIKKPYHRETLFTALRIQLES